MKKVVLAVAALALVGGAVYAIQDRDVRNQIASVAAFATGVREETVPAGTAITVRLENRLSTRHSSVGDAFRATLTAPIRTDEQVVIPEGAVVEGHVAVVEQPGKVKGRGLLQLVYDDLRFGGRSYDLDTRSVMYQGGSGARRDAAMIGGGAVAGGIIGGVTGHSRGAAVKGALIGGAVGTGAALMTRGPQLVFEPGTVLRFRLDHDVDVKVERS